MALETLNGVKNINGVDIAHLPAAIPKEEYLELIKNKFIIHGEENNTLIFKIQNGPIKENGINGCQVTDIIAVTKFIYEELNNSYPSTENTVSIALLKQVLALQELRTENREQRIELSVEYRDSVSYERLI